LKLTVQTALAVAVPADSKFLVQLPTYDDGFFDPTKTVICDFDGTPYTCVTYPSLGWILIDVLNPATIPLTSSEMNIQNLRWPRSSNSAGTLTWIAFSATSIELFKNRVQVAPGGSPFPAPAPNDFVVADLVELQKGKGFSGQVFRFEF
jgi:hypothetical protein